MTPFRGIITSSRWFGGAVSKERPHRIEEVRPRSMGYLTVPLFRDAFRHDRMKGSRQYQAIRERVGIQITDDDGVCVPSGFLGVADRRREFPKLFVNVIEFFPNRTDHVGCREQEREGLWTTEFEQRVVLVPSEFHDLHSSSTEQETNTRACWYPF